MNLALLDYYGTLSTLKNAVELVQKMRQLNWVVFIWSGGPQDEVPLELLSAVDGFIQKGSGFPPVPDDFKWDELLFCDDDSMIRGVMTRWAKRRSEPCTICTPAELVVKFPA